MTAQIRSSTRRSSTCSEVTTRAHPSIESMVSTMSARWLLTDLRSAYTLIARLIARLVARLVGCLVCLRVSHWRYPFFPARLPVCALVPAHRVGPPLAVSRVRVRLRPRPRPRPRPRLGLRFRCWIASCEMRRRLGSRPDASASCPSCLCRAASTSSCGSASRTCSTVTLTPTFNPNPHTAPLQHQVVEAFPGRVQRAPLRRCRRRQDLLPARGTLP